MKTELVRAAAGGPPPAATETVPDNLGVQMDFNAFPWMAQLQQWAGGIQATCLIVLGICGVAGVVLFIVGRMSSSQQVQKVTASILFWVIIAAIIIGAIFAIIVWATGFDMGFGSA